MDQALAGVGGVWWSGGRIRKALVRVIWPELWRRLALVERIARRERP